MEWIEQMTQKHAARGSTVTVRYTIQLENGSKVGAHKPMTMSFTIGDGTVFPVLEKAVVGLGVNQVRSVAINPEQGYGDYNESLVLQVERKAFPDDMPLIPGKTVQYQNRDGQRSNFVIQEVKEDRVTLDGNHPLAGQSLIYEVELEKID